MNETKNNYRFTPQNISQQTSEKEKKVDQLINCINALTDNFDEINDLVQIIANRVIERLMREQTSACQSDQDEEIENEPSANHPVLAASFSPEGILMAMPFDSFFEAYDWFGESEVVEPVPGIPGVYMTYNRNKLITDGEHVWLPDSIVAYRVDDQDNVISLSGKDMYNLCNTMKLISEVIINDTTNERKVAFALK